GSNIDGATFRSTNIGWAEMTDAEGVTVRQMATAALLSGIKGLPDRVSQSPILSSRTEDFKIS
ncbi:MAG: hypothetical protein ACRC0L_05825, partial [Angustibacter sp.]